MPRRQLRTPVLLLGGLENSLSLARSLSGLGVPVDISADAGNPALQSRSCRRAFAYDGRTQASDYWGKLLSSDPSPVAEGTVVLGCSDDAVEFIARNAHGLKARYVLDYNDPSVQLAMLDKQKTLELARDVGCEAPAFWRVRTPADLETFEEHLAFPAIIKPLHSHLFLRSEGRKHIAVNTRAELREGIAGPLRRGLEIMVCELIPGPDDLLSSYYTYVDQTGEPAFHFTKRVLRRYPMNEGGGCYHVTAWLPETAQAGLEFFRGIGFRGLGCVEFKRDPRDGRLKLIECNARFTAAHELLVRSGFDIGRFIYRRLVGDPIPPPSSYLKGLHMWYPRRDWMAFRQLRQRGLLTTGEWLRSLAHRQVFPYFSVRDPWPAVWRGFRRR